MSTQRPSPSQNTHSQTVERASSMPRTSTWKATPTNQTVRPKRRKRTLPDYCYKTPKESIESRNLNKDKDFKISTTTSIKLSSNST